jgi:hypothetical protein
MLILYVHLKTVTSLFVIKTLKMMHQIAQFSIIESLKKVFSTALDSS